MEYVFRVKFQNKKKIITLSEDELNWRTFVDNGLLLFGVRIHENSVVYLTDNMGTDIPEKLFVFIIKNFWNGSNFYVEIKYKPNESNNNDLVTPENIEKYFKSMNLHRFLDEEIEAEQVMQNGDECAEGILQMPVDKRRQLIRHLVDFMVKSFGTHPSLHQKIATAKAVIMVFPRLACKNSKIGGIDLLVNGDKGWFNSRLKCVREAQKKLNKTTKGTPKRNSQVPAVDEGAVDQLAAADVIFLKSLVVSDGNMDEFIQKLNFTRNYRQKMLLDKNIHLKEHFPYFFTNPELILKEFELSNKRLKASAFLDKWSMVAPQLRRILANHYKLMNFSTDWCMEIENILILLKMFPYRQVGRNVIASDATFRKSIDKFIQYEPLNAVPLPSWKGYPRIIACGDSKKEIAYYYIQLENLVFSMPKEFNFVQAFDLFFKVHQVFNQAFEPSLVNMMTFVQHAVYQMPEHGLNVTNRMKEVINMLE